MLRIGVIGLGSFGRFASSLVPKDCELLGYDTHSQNLPEGMRPVGLEAALQTDIVILTIPLQALRQVLPQLKSLLSPETLLIDVCSVKVIPEELYDEFLPNHPNLLLTHPLFGPNSAATSTVGHELIVTKSKGDQAKRVTQYCEKVLRLRVTHLSSEEHDKVMSQVHALTFFVSRGLEAMQLERVPFQTPSYDMILDLIAFSQVHSKELYDTIELGNPYAAIIREQLISTLQSLENELKTEAN